MCIVPSNVFTYSKAAGFIAEASEFPYDLVHQFYIRSVNTGVKKLFLLDKEVRDAEGDILMWEFFCPGENFRATILND